MKNALIKNAALAANGLNPVRNNSPAQYQSRQKQYFDPETRAFTQQVARYSSDFVEAQVQGLDPDDFFAWGTYRMRFADVVRPSSAIQRHFDDYKMVLFESPKIEYIRPGTKIVTMGSTWLATNPVNVSGASGSAVIRRCNAVWNYLDYYGNVVSEPIIVENERANANDSDAQNSQLITKGYFNVICQNNDATRQIDTNTRFILGSAAYRVTGYSDFEMEFTGDYSTVRLLSFSVRYEEPNFVIDDMVNHVAGGLTFSWGIRVNGASSMFVGAESQLLATSYRNGSPVSESEEYPTTYLWESSDENVLTIDDSGVVTAVGEGTASIRATLMQNQNYHTNFEITVENTKDGVFFTNTVPYALAAYDDITLYAAYFEDGAETSEAVTFTLSGAAEGSYSYITGPKAVTIYCYEYSESPLTVTVNYGNYSASAEIRLEGI